MPRKHQPHEEDRGRRTRAALLRVLCVLALAGWCWQAPQAHAADSHPLEPLDTSSPRATLNGFLSVADELGRVAKQYLEAPSREHSRGILWQGERARRFLDMSHVATAARIEVSSDVLVQLWEVLGRIELPAPEQIPDAATMEARVAAGQAAQWTIPHTELTITRVKEGSQAGQYLFSPATVARMREFYHRVADLPYVRPMTLEHPRQLMLLSGGPWIPHRLLNALPGWLKVTVGDQVIWKWLALVLLLGGWFALVWIIHRWAGRFSTAHTLGTYVRPLAAPVSFLLLSRVVNYVTGYQIQITGAATTSVQFLVSAATYVALAWLIWQAALFIAEFIISSPRIPDQSLDAHLLRLVARVMGLVGLVGVLFYGGNQLGLPLYGLIAGVSVGGLAIALATQATLENFIGSINLFADRPVSVGEVCRYGDMLGTVEEIGLRSTRLRGVDRTVTTVPNAEFSKTKIVNLSRRDRILLQTSLGLRYETTPEQLRFLLAKLRELLIAHPRILEEAARVRFVGYGSSSLDVEVFAYVATRDYVEFLAIREDVFLRVIDLVTEAGTGFAFPSQTLYLGRDSGLDAQAAEAAQSQMMAWRGEQKLPFPNPDPERVQALRDTLDWPPAGSPGAKSPTTETNPPSTPAPKRA